MIKTTIFCLLKGYTTKLTWKFPVDKLVLILTGDFLVRIASSLPNVIISFSIHRMKDWMLPQYSVKVRTSDQIEQLYIYKFM